MSFIDTFLIQLKLRLDFSFMILISFQFYGNCTLHKRLTAMNDDISKEIIKRYTIVTRALFTTSFLFLFYTFISIFKVTDKSKPLTKSTGLLLLLFVSAKK
jgi:hypothetical protein